MDDLVEWSFVKHNVLQWRISKLLNKPPHGIAWFSDVHGRSRSLLLRFRRDAKGFFVRFFVPEGALSLVQKARAL